MEKIDILMPKYADCPYYTVDTSGLLSVPVLGVADIPLYISNSTDLMGMFSSRDNIRILSCGFYIPESYVFADTSKSNQTVAGNELALKVYKGQAKSANAAVTTDNTSLTDTRLNMTVNVYAGYELYCYGKTMTVISNTATKFTGAAWSGGGNPGAGKAWNCTFYSTVMPGLGPRGVIALPFANYEIALDVFCDMSSISLDADNNFFIYGATYPNDLSMIGVPAALDGATVKVIPFIKILHTLDISA